MNDLDEIQREDVTQDHNFLLHQQETLKMKLLELEGIAKKHADNKSGKDLLESVITLLHGHLSAQVPRIDHTDIQNYGREVDAMRQKFRTLFHMAVAAIITTHSCAASQKTSLEGGDDFKPTPHTEVPYNRYGTEELYELEQNLAEVLGVNQDGLTLLLTSSGMSAYQLIEIYLLRKVLSQGDLILLVGGIYFETQKQITSLRGFHTRRTGTSVAEFKQSVTSQIPKLIVLETMNNDLDLRITNVTEILEVINGMDLKEDVFVMIDGTMIPESARDFFEVKNSRIKVLYFASCGKYMQEGLDLTMAGLLVCDQKIGSTMQELRRASGTILYEPATSLFVAPNSKIHEDRSARMTRNATLLAEGLEIIEGVDVRYPKLSSHPDYDLAKGKQSLGAVLTFRFCEESLNRTESLQQFINLLFKNAAASNVPVTQGVSFGFSHPRITLVYSQEPFTHLRLSSGDRSLKEVLEFKQILLESIQQFIHSHVTLSI